MDALALPSNANEFSSDAVALIPNALEVYFQVRRLLMGHQQLHLNRWQLFYVREQSALSAVADTSVPIARY